jgi:hypothetical protein
VREYTLSASTLLAFFAVPFLFADRDPSPDVSARTGVQRVVCWVKSALATFIHTAFAWRLLQTQCAFSSAVEHIAITVVVGILFF